MSNLRFHNDTCAINHIWYESHKNLITSICIGTGNVDRIEEFALQLLGPPHKFKAMRDPKKPKRAKSAYLFYCDASRKQVMEALKKSGTPVQIAIVSKKLGAMWQQLSVQDREQYKLLSLKDQARYKDEMEVYNA